MTWNELFERGAAHGVITYDDAEECGVPRSTLDRRALTEGWPPRPYPGVIRLPGRQLDGRGRIEAAVRSVSGVTAVGGDAALYLHGLVQHAPSCTLLWVPARHRGKSTRTRLVRRSSVLEASDLTIVDDVPVVRPAWAVRDVAGDRSVDALRNLLIDGRFSGSIRESDTRRVLERDHRFAGRARYAEAVAQLADDGSDSGFEFRTRGRLATLGFRFDQEQLLLSTDGRDRRVDLPIRDLRVGVECLGFRYHGDRAQLDADAERWNDLATVPGWLTLHLTYSMQYGRPWDAFVARLGSVLAFRGYTPA